MALKNIPIHFSYLLPFLLLTAPLQVAAITPNQIAAEVQIVCPDNQGNWFSGSGTLIDPKGIILTNRHVITGVDGTAIKTCFIGFINSIDQEPNFGTKENPNLAEVKFFTTTKDMDAAILYLGNPSNKVYPYVNIWNSDSGKLTFGDKLEVIGYPGIGGSTITYTSGDFSGFGSESDGTINYIKTTAVLEHGNSGGSAYSSTGQFIGIPTMVVSGKLNSLSYILSINSVKSWLNSILGTSYKNEIIQDQAIIVAPRSNIQAQPDITPPFQKSFFIGFTAYNDKGEWMYYGHRYGDSRAAVYEFPKIRFQLSDFSDDQGTIKGYYYYFGENPQGVPKEVGKYIAATDLICDKYCELVPETFTASAGKSNYFIVQAVDSSGNVSNPLINFQYIYEPDNFKDIKSFDIRTLGGKLLGNLKYPTLEESPRCQAFAFCNEGRILDYTVLKVFTNQDTLILYPNYSYPINGLTYYLSYGDDRWWTDKLRIGKTTTDNFLKVSNLRSKGTTNIFLKPNKNNVNSFFGKHLILQITHIPTVNGVVAAESDSTDFRELLKFTPVEEKVIQKMGGFIFLQVESHGEAWYVNPKDGKRYYMKDGSTAYDMMRRFGLGITDADLNQIPQAGEGKVYPARLNSLKGKILLQVQSHGEAWYINPKTGYRTYLKDGDAAYQLMRSQGVGITNGDLAKIQIGNL
jgi:hypothetical protein